MQSRNSLVVCAVVVLAASARLSAAVCQAPCDVGMPGDYDGDGDIDIADFPHFSACATRATVPQLNPDCGNTDLDGDGDTDADDFGLWQREFSGACDCPPAIKEPPHPPLASVFKGEVIGIEPSFLRFGTSDENTGSRTLVHPWSGEFVERTVDLVIKSRGPDIVWGRTYRSRLGPDTAMGNGWDFSYNIRIERVGQHMRVYNGDGRNDVFRLQPNGTWARNEFFSVLSSSAGNTHTMTFADTSRWIFRPLDNSPAAGKIASSIDRNGNTITFNYDGTGRLFDMIDPVGRVVQIQYNPAGLIASVTDFTGRQLQYAYYEEGDAGGSAGDLKSFTTPAVIGTPHGNDFPSGKTTVYTYSKDFADDRLNHNLLTITNPNGQTFLTNIYAPTQNPVNPGFDRVIRQVWGNPGDNIDLTFAAQTPSPANNNAVMLAIINNRVGEVIHLFYDAGNRLVMKRDLTGRADPDQPTTLADNLPTDKLRSDDPTFFETRINYNVDSLPTAMLLPNGNSVQNVYQLDLNPSAVRRSRGNLRERHRLPGPLGGDHPQIDESWTYNAIFNLPATWTDGRGNQRQYTYDTQGNLTQIQHRIPSKVEDFEYNAFGQITAHILPANNTGHRRRDESTYYGTGPQKGYREKQILDAPGLALTTTYQYDAVGNLTAVTDPAGEDAQYVVNALDQVVRTISREITNGSGVRYERDYHYDANSNVVQVDVQNKDESGALQANTHITTTHTYGVLNERLTTSQEIDGVDNLVEDRTFDDEFRPVLFQSGETVNGNQPANTITTAYDERGLVYRITAAEGTSSQSTTQYDYDGNGNRKKIRAGLEDLSGPRIGTITLDGYELASVTQDPMGNVVTCHYDEAGNRTSQRLDGQMVDIAGGTGNVRLSEVTYTYDPENRLTQVERAHFNPATQAPIGDGAAESIIEYADNDQMKRTVNDNTRETLYGYDTLNRFATRTDARGNSAAYFYNANSQVVLTTELEKSDAGLPDQTYTTALVRDNLQRVSSRTDSGTNTTEYQYDSRGNLVRTVDARDNVSRRTYDGRNLLLKTEHDLTTTGDGSGAVTGTITTDYTYDHNGRLTTVTDSNNRTTTYSYDALNRLLSVTHADATVRSQIYNVHGEPVSLTDPNGSVVTSGYDALGRLTSRSIVPAADVLGTSSESYTYDGLSRVRQAQNNEANVQRAYDSLSNLLTETLNGQMITCTYDGVGNLAASVYPGGRTLSYTYDLLERPATLVEAGNTFADFDYAGPSRLEQLTYPQSNSAHTVRGRYEYDSSRRIMRTTWLRNPAGSPVTLDQREYAYDATYNHTGRTDLVPTPANFDYNFDSASRLIGSERTPPVPGQGIITYGLDEMSNRTSVTGGGEPGAYTLDPATPEPADAQVHQYTTTSFDARLYDKNGNLTRINNSQPTQRNLAYNYRDQLVAHVNTALNELTVYKYDALGRRVVRIVDAGGPSPQETRYFYQGNSIIEEQNAAGVTQATYGVMHYPHNGSHLTMRRGGNNFQLMFDGFESVIAAGDSTGSVVERYSYHDYGAVKITDEGGTPLPQSAIGNPRFFRSMQFDRESGLYSYDHDLAEFVGVGSSYYDPRAGRSISRTTGLNSYSPFVFPIDPEMLLAVHVPRIGQEVFGHSVRGYDCMDEEDFPFNSVHNAGGMGLYSSADVDTLFMGNRRRRYVSAGAVPGAVAAGPAPVPTVGSPVILSGGALRRVRGGIAASSGDEAGTLKELSYRPCMYPMCGGMYVVGGQSAILYNGHAGLGANVVESLNVKYLKTDTEVVDYQAGSGLKLDTQLDLVPTFVLLKDDVTATFNSLRRGYPVKWEGPDFDAFNPKEIGVDKSVPW